SRLPGLNFPRVGAFDERYGRSSHRTIVSGFRHGWSLLARKISGRLQRAHVPLAFRLPHRARQQHRGHHSGPAAFSWDLGTTALSIRHLSLAQLSARVWRIALRARAFPRLHAFLTSPSGGAGPSWG